MYQIKTDNTDCIKNEIQLCCAIRYFILYIMSHTKIWLHFQITKRNNVFRKIVFYRGYETRRNCQISLCSEENGFGFLKRALPSGAGAVRYMSTTCPTCLKISLGSISWLYLWLYPNGRCNALHTVHRSRTRPASKVIQIVCLLKCKIVFFLWLQ